MLILSVINLYNCRSLGRMPSFLNTHTNTHPINTPEYNFKIHTIAPKLYTHKHTHTTTTSNSDIINNNITAQSVLQYITSHKNVHNRAWDLLFLCCKSIVQLILLHPCFFTIVIVTSKHKFMKISHIASKTTHLCTASLKEGNDRATISLRIRTTANI